MIATVTGIAPLRSLLRAALHRGTTDRFTILHGASHADELVFRDELLDLAAHDTRIAYHPTISRPGAAERGMDRRDRSSRRTRPAAGGRARPGDDTSTRSDTPE